VNLVLIGLLTAALTGPSRPPLTRDFTLAPGEVISTTIFHAESGATIVIVPGLIGSSYGFRHVVPALAERGHRVIIVDVLGAGRSSKPVKADYTLLAQSRRVEAVLDSLQVRNSVMVAHALGGSVVYRLALRRPDLIHSIVGIDAGASDNVATSGLRRALRLAPIIKFFGARRVLIGKIKDGLIDASYDPAWVTPDVVAHYAAAYQEDAGHMLRVLNAMAAAREPELLIPQLTNLYTPVLLLVGSHKSALAAEKIELLRTSLPNFRVQRIEAGGQFLHEEQPSCVVGAILSVVESE
jgi:pimeloyl-ACP methyl ester carboxylesterase